MSGLARDPRVERLRAAPGDGVGALRLSAIEAADRIRPFVRRTPAMALEDGAFGVDARLLLKFEHMQISGSFKARGAFNRLLTPGAPSLAIAASGGNHGVAVATAAGALGREAEIYVPSVAGASKRAAIEATGATLTVAGAEYAVAAASAAERAAEAGVETIHAYDQWEVAAGQGTLGLEFAAQAAEMGAPLDAVILAVGGGGLMGGVASAIGDRTRIVCVEPERAPTLNAARRAGEPVDVAVGGLAADALGARRIGEIGFAVSSARVADEDLILVPDEAIAAARRYLWRMARQSVEPAGATGLAALLAGAWRPPAGAVVGLVLCGANADPAL